MIQIKMCNQNMDTNLAKVVMSIWPTNEMKKDGYFFDRGTRHANVVHVLHPLHGLQTLAQTTAVFNRPELMAEGSCAVGRWVDTRIYYLDSQFCLLMWRLQGPLYSHTYITCWYCI